MRRNHLADVIRNRLKFESALADPDLWFKPMAATDGTCYYAYILVYVDNILKESYMVKPSSNGEPKVYLGADISKAYYSDDSYARTMGSKS